MRLLPKTIFIISLSLLLLIISSGILFGTIIRHSFKELEEKDTYHKTEQIISVFMESIGDLNEKSADWAKWDDTYQFMKDRNENYINSNINIQTFSDLKIDIIVYVNSTGDVIFSKNYDFASGQGSEVNSEFLAHLKKNCVLINYSSLDFVKSGVMVIKDNALKVSARPILTTEGNGPIIGTIIFGAFIDEDTIAELRDTIQLPIDLHLVDSNNSLNSSITFGPKLHEPSEKAKKTLLSLHDDSKIYIQPINESTISGFALFNDIDNSPRIILEFEHPRYIYKAGLATLNYLLISIVTVSIILGLVIIFSLRSNILSRLSEINKSIKEVSETKDLKKQIKITGKDELNELADEINNMIFIMDQSGEQIKDINKRLEDKLTDLQKFRDLTSDSEIYAEQMRKERDEALNNLRKPEQKLDVLKRRSKK